MGSEHNTQIVKGKRTKRQRSSSSPFGFPATDTSSSGSGDAYYPYESTEEEEQEEEEQDMANCLIMLAQGDPFQKSSVTVRVTSDDNNKVGLYIYECKTCNRSFTSFQALGGHRASHKKPKATLELAEKKSPSSTGFDSSGSNPPLVVHHNHNNNKGGNKIHECSICGSEFTSGQALGGHMRRHRAAAAATANKQLTNESNIIAGAVSATTRSVLPLDLNLPAPEDDRYIGSLVFSASALVDCHY